MPWGTFTSSHLTEPPDADPVHGQRAVLVSRRIGLRAEAPTPRTKILEPGKYAIKLTKAGFKSWRRKIEVAAGEQVPVKVELEKK